MSLKDIQYNESKKQESQMLFFTVTTIFSLSFLSYLKKKAKTVNLL
jgi:hypothetical protein